MPTVLPDLDVEKIRRFCRTRVPAAMADKVRIEDTARGKTVSILSADRPGMAARVSGLRRQSLSSDTRAMDCGRSTLPTETARG